MQNRLAHTAEHAFIGSLQKLLGKTLNVRKVEHRDYDNIVIIKATDLNMDIIIKAEHEVNSLITQGRRILIRTFHSLDEARNQIPSLRANENRIVNNQSLFKVDCNRMFKEITSKWGKGGGKSNFVTGVIRKEKVDEFITTIVRNLVTK
jgi:hypothetical protein